MPNISVAYVKITKKKRSAAEPLVFSKLEDVFLCLEKIIGRSKIDPGVRVYGLCKDGRTGFVTGSADVEVKSDWKDYFLAQRVAQETGLLRSRHGGDEYTRTRAAGLAFARAMDEQLTDPLSQAIK
ncbi:MAG: hypothetical protein BZY80_04295 [SAR202 cluster bacterium Io17-Chloro-G2]|nr:MAG: hypothetical protein BZY80_04295 [SAR202 cluster bacterium Io17-Chloro-G2]